MKNTLWLFAALAGCGTTAPAVPDDGAAPPPPSPFVEYATVAAVSGDQKLLAYYAGFNTLADGKPAGALGIKALPDGAAFKISDGAFGAAFGAGSTTLVFAENPTASTDPNAAAFYGNLRVWTPKLSAPLRLTNDFGTRIAAAPDASALLVVDSPAPNPAAPQSALSLFRPAACSGQQCTGVLLEGSAVITAVTMSQDGRFGAYVKKTGDGFQAKFETFLVNVQSGQAQKVTETTAPGLASAPVALSPDGNLLASAINGSGLIPAPLQLRVVRTNNSQQVMYRGLPEGTGVVQLDFADNSTLIAHAFQASSRGLYRLTAMAGAQLVPTARVFYLSPSPVEARRYLFSMTGGAGPTGTLQMLDLSAEKPGAVGLAANASLPPLVSDNLKWAAFLDPGPRTLFAAALPTGVSAPLGVGVNSHQFAFAPGGGKLLFVDRSDGTGAGTLTAWDEIGAVLDSGVNAFRALPGGTIYYSVSAPDLATGRKPGIYKTQLP